jgi:hypothetical protein
LLRALLLQVRYRVRSERLLMEQLDYDLLFPWFVGLAADDPIWDAPATATKPFTSIGYASNPAPIILFRSSLITGGHGHDGNPPRDRRGAA